MVGPRKARRFRIICVSSASGASGAGGNSTEPALNSASAPNNTCNISSTFSDTNGTDQVNKSMKFGK
ncbi:uncharacterized protein BcabD6B2_49820 [Babesia caballi]|uniref:Uncharacterized protein n=1 Tax=Babesia caballi TaxID=5871 RepID=A0AAV4M0X1_BABCB|nr:hypothetical protein BcabD6B2_49820 [Babesia caballi]